MIGHISGGLSGALGPVSGAVAASAITVAASAAAGGLGGAFKEELARCEATSGCNVDGLYQRWTAVGNDQQKAAMSSMDAMLGADPNAAAEAGISFGATAAPAISGIKAKPTDVYLSELSGVQCLWTPSATLQHDSNICRDDALVNKSVETSNRGR